MGNEWFVYTQLQNSKTKGLNPIIINGQKEKIRGTILKYENKVQKEKRKKNSLVPFQNLFVQYLHCEHFDVYSGAFHPAYPNWLACVVMSKNYRARLLETNGVKKRLIFCSSKDREKRRKPSWMWRSSSKGKGFCKIPKAIWNKENKSILFISFFQVKIDNEN